MTARGLKAVPPVLLLLGVICLTGLPGPAAAYFEESDIGTRAVGFGKAFTAIADDATAIYWNPAGLARLDRGELDLTHSRPYTVQNLSSNYLAAAYPLGPATGGVSWHHLGVSDVINEDTFSFAAARNVYASAGGTKLAVGGALKVLRVSFPGYADPVTLEEVNFGSATRVSADLGALVSFPNRMSLGYSVRNLGSPEFDLVEGSAGGTSLPVKSRLGWAYQWNPESTVSVEYQETDDGSGVVNIGGEIWFYRAFAIRAGINDVNAGGGVSIKAKRWLLDLAFITNRPLGASYRAGLRVPFNL